METGKYYDIEEDDYHGGPEISKSGLDVFNKSPMHYYYNKNKPKDDDESITFKFGRLVHCSVLEPGKFKTDYVTAPEKLESYLTTTDDLKSTLKSLGLAVSGKKEALINRLLMEKPELEPFVWECIEAKFNKENEGREVLTNKEFSEIEAITKAVRSHPAAGFLFKKGRSEVSYFWEQSVTNEETGEIITEACRARMDYERDDGFIVDLKTTVDASLEGFKKSFAKYRYHVQAGMYSDAYEAVNGVAPKGFIFVAIEKKPPYAVGIYAIEERALEAGKEIYKKDLFEFSKVKQAGAWDMSYSNKIETIDLPDWYYRQQGE